MERLKIESARTTVLLTPVELIVVAFVSMLKLKIDGEEGITV